MVTVPVRDEGLVLEGVWQSGDPPAAVVAPPHPLYGGSFDNPVVNEIAHALYRQGSASLRFNWRGVGASQGRATGDLGVAERDYRAALELVVENSGAPVTAAGYSFGAAAATRVALHDDRVAKLVLVAPPVELLKALDLQRLQKPVRVVVGGNDAFAPAEELSELFGPLPDARVGVIPDADHFFVQSGLGALARELQE
jgi:alpha/beta superfamily hydrolase